MKCLVFLLLVTSLTFTVGAERPSCDTWAVQDTETEIQCSYLGPSSTYRLQDALARSASECPECEVVLEIFHSSIDGFPDDIFGGFRIKQLSLSYGDLTEVPIRLLQNINSTSFSILNLADNAISQVGPTEFEHLPFSATLTVLDLGGNRLAAIPAHTFDALPNLANLDLQKNSVRRLVAGVFSGLSALQDLALSFNDITDVEVDALPTSSQLTVLLLNDNRIEFLQEGSFSSEMFGNLMSISLYDNPFYCNCSLEWFKDLLDEFGQTDGSGATCSYPEQAPFGEVDFCAKRGK